MKHNIKKTILVSALYAAMYPVVVMATNIPSYDAVAMADMVELDDEEMSSEVGQALLSLAYTAPTGTGVGASNLDYGYYKLGLEAKMELNLNIRNLQLGCGGVNGPGKCDIDMENVALSGSANGKVVSGVIADNGTPTWSVGRSNTSALLTNPFVEFAIKNPNTAASREVVGFRFSAEDILGYLSAGTVNDIDSNGMSTGGGIKTFSGFIKVAQTPVNSFTDPAIFGTKVDQMINGKITSLGLFPRTIATNPNAMTVGSANYITPPAGTYVYGGSNIWGINVPRQTVSFNFPETVVTGTRMSQLNLVVKDVPIPTIGISGSDGGIRLRLDAPISLLFGAIFVEDATFFMGDQGSRTLNVVATGSPAYLAMSATDKTGNDRLITSGITPGNVGCLNSGNNASAGSCSYIKNLKANVTVKQNFNLVHNLPISSGGYLSLQKQAMQWPGSDALDIAQPGWWMAFKDPLDFGALNPTSGIPMDDVLPQIATFITNYLSQNNINLDIASTFDAVFGAPVYKPIGDITLANDARAVMVLQNLLLDGNQKPVSNCWGGLKFC
ncbi:hypothetical protein FK216_10485 [Moraxellaceae bacterium AER2_44_116]|nr:hypothetical protein [Moraxellaceae bacterium]TQC96993.1 hypothetical protein FK216_10485 [Moraxellaceae bacterium AER2_44_116]